MCGRSGASSLYLWEQLFLWNFFNNKVIEKRKHIQDDSFLCRASICARFRTDVTALLRSWYEKREKWGTQNVPIILSEILLMRARQNTGLLPLASSIRHISGDSSMNRMDVARRAPDIHSIIISFKYHQGHRWLFLCKHWGDNNVALSNPALQQAIVLRHWFLLHHRTLIKRAKLN